jgi:serine/threonine-protein kinase ULK/ATG1
MNVMVLEHQQTMGGLMFSPRPSMQWGLSPQIAVVPPKTYHSPAMMFGVAKQQQARVHQIDNYTVFIDQAIGAGSSSIVYRAKDSRTG